MKKLCLHWVPHDLTDSRKVSRLNTLKEFLSKLQSFSKNQMKKVVTDYESWFFLWYGADGKWTYGGIRPTNTKHNIGDEKVMFFTAFSISGIVLIDVLPKNIFKKYFTYLNIILIEYELINCTLRVFRLPFQTFKVTNIPPPIQRSTRENQEI